MSNNINKSQKDVRTLLAEKEAQKNAAKEHRKKVDDAIKNGEDKQRIIKSWEDHIKAGDKLKNFTSIVNNQMYFQEPAKNHVLLPFSEYFGSYQLNWIINWDDINNVEVWRKNVLYVDLIEWILSTPKN